MHYRFYLHDRERGLRFEGLERKICRDDACYINPGIASTISWNDAQAKCEDKHGSLVSVNSDTEWKMLTLTGLMPWQNASMFYIGYRTKVSD